MLFAASLKRSSAGNGVGSPENSEHRSRKKKKRKDKERENKGSTGEPAGIAGEGLEDLAATRVSDSQPQKKIKLMINFNK
jgi:hypothetical protein